MSELVLSRPAPAALSLPARPRARAAAPESAAERDRIRRARRGDRDAFRELVQLHQDAAYETALRILRSPEEAEEAAQDAFLRVWRALPDFRGDSRFSTWLWTIVTRCALDRARARSRHRDRETGTEPDRLAEHPAPADPRLPLPERLRLARALATLDPQRRAVVTLFYFRDLSVEEVAKALDLPAGTVKSHLHRARGALRRAWRRAGPPAAGTASGEPRS